MLPRAGKNRNEMKMRTDRGIVDRFKRHPAARDCLIATLLVVFTVAVYAPTWNHGFVNYDDDHYVYQNARVQTGLSLTNIEWAFTTTEMGSWHPATWLSLQLDAEIWGDGPAGFHLVNFLLHAANVALVYLVLLRYTGCIGRSAMVALLFGIHPLRVQSVAWISERKDVLSGLFWLMTLLAYRYYASRPSVWRMVWVVAGFGLGLASKPMVITLPCVLLLLDAWPLGRLCRIRDLRPLLLEKAPLFAMAILFSYLTVTSQQHENMLQSTDSIGISERLAAMPVAYWAYLWKTLYPVELAVFYPYSDEIRHLWRPLLALAGLALITWGAFRGRRQRPYVLVGWLWFVGTLIPVIGLVQVGTQAYADRYTYIPHLGLFIAVVWGVADLLAALRASPAVPRAIAVASIAICCVVTRDQMSYWQDSLTMWKRTLEVTRDNDIAWEGLGTHYANAKQLNEALECYAKCCRIQPEILDFRAKRAIIFYQMDRLDEAEREARVALRLRKLRKIQPNEILTQLWHILGDVEARRGNWAMAADYYSYAVQVLETWWLPRFKLAAVMLQLGRTDEAIQQFTATLSLAPDKDKISINVSLGKIHRQRGEFETAIICFQRSVDLEPGNVNYRAELGLALVAAGRLQEARQTAREANLIDPSWAFRLDRAARTLATHADVEKASLETALWLSRLACLAVDPPSAEFLDTLAIAAAALGQFDVAIVTGEQAILLAQQTRRTELAAAISDRLRLYRDRQPYRGEKKAVDVRQ
jgi:tetratricopeptide (TPR) repeat protein